MEVVVVVVVDDVVVVRLLLLLSRGKHPTWSASCCSSCR